VTCLAVVGNTATLVVDSGGSYTGLQVVDNTGPGERDTLDLALDRQPGDCSPVPRSGFFTTIEPGNFTVVDAPALPTSKQQCKKGGFASFGFENQGRCVAFVERPPALRAPAGA
jgi:hypothetical protein